VVSLSFGLGYLADDLGLWARHGLSVKTLEISGVGALNAVISGSTDFAQASGPSFTRAAAKGQRLLAIAELSDKPSIALALRNEFAVGFDAAAPLAVRAHFLAGRTISIDAVNSINHAYLRLLAKRAGLDPESIRIAVLPIQSAVAAYEKKDIDGYISGPPWPQKAVLDGTGVIIASGPDGDPADAIPFASLVLATKPETCAKRPAVCRGMGRSFEAAAEFLHDHPADALALFKKRFPNLDDKLLAAGLEVVLKYVPRPLTVTKLALEHDEIVSVDAGLLAPADKLTDYEGLYTNEYLR
jgi:ABC-type nitrate/sulfonate/bicarbonate transport system substrate-binding protein